jgi:hypothetical protein
LILENTVQCQCPVAERPREPAMPYFSAERYRRNGQYGALGMS